MPQHIGRIAKPLSVLFIRRLFRPDIPGAYQFKQARSTSYNLCSFALAERLICHCNEDVSQSLVAFGYHNLLIKKVIVFRVKNKLGERMHTNTLERVALMRSYCVGRYKQVFGNLVFSHLLRIQFHYFQFPR